MKPSTTRSADMNDRLQAACLCVVLFLAGLVTTQVHGEETHALPEAHRVVAEVTGEVFDLIRETQAQEHIDIRIFKADVYDLLNPRLDWAGFSRGVMGVHFANASDEQRDSFVESVRSILLEFYAEAMLRLRDQELRVVPPSGPSSNPDRVNVDLEFVGADGSVIPIVFYMRRASGDNTWRLVNINLSGINLGLTWRSQFGRIMDTAGDIDQAIIQFAAAVEAASLGSETAGA